VTPGVASLAAKNDSKPPDDDCGDIDDRSDGYVSDADLELSQVNLSGEIIDGPVMLLGVQRGNEPASHVGSLYGLASSQQSIVRGSQPGEVPPSSEHGGGVDDDESRAEDLEELAGLYLSQAFALPDELAEDPAFQAAVRREGGSNPIRQMAGHYLELGHDRSDHYMMEQGGTTQDESSFMEVGDLHDGPIEANLSRIPQLDGPSPVP